VTPLKKTLFREKDGTKLTRRQDATWGAVRETAKREERKREIVAERERDRSKPHHIQLQI
jgi:hypothetical protein